MLRLYLGIGMHINLFSLLLLKDMLWILKRTISLRRFFLLSTTYLLLYYIGVDERKLYLVLWEQQRCRPSCAYTHANQPLCCSLYGKNNTYICYVQNFKILVNACTCSWFGHYFVALLCRVFSRRGPIKILNLSFLVCIIYRSTPFHSR